MNASLSHATLRTWLGRFTLCVGLLVGLVVSRPAQAFPVCTYGAPVNLLFGTINVPRDAATGTLIGSAQTVTATINCTGGTTPWQFIYNSGLSAGPQGYATGITGVSLRVTDVTFANKNLSAAGFGTWLPQTPTNADFSGSVTLTFQLVKAGGPVTTGGRSNVPIILLFGDTVPSTPLAGGIKVNIGNLTVVATTCSVTTPSIIVNLPSVMATQLSPTGATAGNTPFNIGLVCAPGASVYVTLTDQTTPSNTTNQLTPATGSTATGVRLRVLNSGGTPVSYGPASASPGTTNQWLIGPSSTTSGIPLTAQYISTGPVTPGVLNGLATFTMSYQ